MSEKRRFTQLEIYDFGPFKEAKIELAPLTIFIGKNALGKSMLLYLIWTLESTIPNIRKLQETLDKELNMSKVVERIFEEEIDGELLKKLLMEHLRFLPMVWAEELKETLHGAFGVKPNELIHSETDETKILIKGENCEMEVSIRRDDISARWLTLDENFIKDNISIDMKEKNLTITLKDYIPYERYISHPLDITGSLIGFMQGVVYDLFGGICGATPGLETLLVDGRAGITRTLLTTYPGIGLTIRDILRADYHFVDSLYKLASDYLNGKIDLEAPALKSLLRELNCKPIIEEEFGIPRIYVEALGKRIPLEKSPSGVREVIPLLLGLLSERTSILYVEEPETHLHPGAVILLPRLMGYAINMLGKDLRLTTHSDLFIMAVNNLIALSSNPEGAKELGYSEEELIEPDMVRAYLLKKADDHVEVVELPVMEDGFDESAFEEVAEELFRERSEVMRLLEEKKSR